MKKVGILLGVILIVFLVVGSYYFFNKGEERTVIAEWNDYVLLSNASEYEKELFAKLNDDLEGEELATLIFQLFLANFYSLDLADSKNDVRGVDFVFENFQNDFIEIAKTTVYSGVEHNYFHRRTQELPIVTEIEVIDVMDSEFTINEIEYQSYIIRGVVIFDIEMGYEKEVEVELIAIDDKYAAVRLDMYRSN